MKQKDETSKLKHLQKQAIENMQKKKSMKQKITQYDHD